jgi:hypothetical protein
MNVHDRSQTISPTLALVAWAALLLAAAAVTSAQPAGEELTVTGKVYNAQRRGPDDPAPVTPFSTPQLTSDPNSPAGSLILHRMIVGDGDLYAVNPKSMVLVSLEDADSGILLSQDGPTTTGDFTLHFTAPKPNFQSPPRVIGVPRRVTERSVRFVVHDAVSGDLLLRSRPVSIWAGANQRWLLVESEPTEIGDRIESPTRSGAFLFTRVGKIESHLIDGAGRATVSPADAGALHIPEYQNAPFGGTLYLFGAFSSQYYTDQYCYQLLVDGKPLTSPLTKTRYTISNGQVVAEGTRMDKANRWGVAHCYQLTPMSQPAPSASTVFWSFPDLLAVWPTGAKDLGRKKVEVKLFERLASGSAQEVSLQAGFLSSGGGPRRDLRTLTLDVDNRPVTLGFDAIRQQLSGSNLLQDACQTVHLASGDALVVEFHAAHPALLEWSLGVSSNSGVSAGGASWKYPDPNSAIHPYTLPASAFVDPCAYSFHVFARARTTDGYGYLYWANRQQIYYVNP